MNADGTGQTQLTFPGPNNDHAHGPAFSPDGQTDRLLALRRDVGRHDISMMNADGSGRLRADDALADSFDDFNPDYSPDGRRSSSTA